jgi:hypothetical protein
VESLPPGSSSHPDTGGAAPDQAQEKPLSGGESSGTNACHLAAPRLWGVALGAAALGGLVVWLYLRSGSTPQARVSHRLDELRHRLEDLSKELARYASREQGRTTPVE